MSRGPQIPQGLTLAIPFALRRGHVMVFMAALLNLAELLITGNGLFVLVRVRLARRIRAGIADIEDEFADAIAGLRLIPRTGPVSCELWLYSRYGTLRHFRIEDAGLVEIDCYGTPLGQGKPVKGPACTPDTTGPLLGPAAAGTVPGPAASVIDPKSPVYRWLVKWNAERKSGETAGILGSSELKQILTTGKPGGTARQSTGKNRPGRKQRGQARTIRRKDRNRIFLSNVRENPRRLKCPRYPAAQQMIRRHRLQEGTPGAWSTPATNSRQNRRRMRRRSEMHSTEAEMASGYPFSGAVRQLSGKKRHPSSGNRPFHPQIGDMAPFACPEMTTFGNATGRSYGCRCAGGLPGNSWTGMPFCDPGPGQGCFPGIQSAEAKMAPDYPFFGAVRQLFSKNRHPGSGNRPFHPQIGDLAPFTCPEMTTFGNAAGQDIGTDGLGAVSRRGMKEPPWQRFRGYPAVGAVPGCQHMTAAGPAAGTIRREMYRRRMREHVEEMNPL